jgi:hypothetical protein
MDDKESLSMRGPTVRVTNEIIIGVEDVEVEAVENADC